MPARLASKYGGALANPELLKLHDEAALSEARAVELLGMLDTGGGAEAWANVSGALAAYRAAHSAGDGVRIAAAFTALEAAVEAGAGEAAVWSELFDVLDRGARYKAAERKLAVTEATSIQIEEALALIGAVMGIIRQNVGDRKVLSAITDGIEGLLDKADN